MPPASARSSIARGEGAAEVVFISAHQDKLVGVDHGYGKATKPEDYLREFSDFIRAATPSRHS
jgi:type I restriction enzyme, R subunit